MKTIDLKAQKHSVDELIELADSENIILRTSDGREFVLAEVDDFDHEIALTRQNTELTRFLEKRSKSKVQYSAADARRRLGL